MTENQPTEGTLETTHNHSHEGHHHPGHHNHAHLVQVKNVEKVSPTQVQLTIHWPADVVAEEEKKVVREISKTAKLPGFRPGKIPVNMIYQKYEAAIRKELLNHLLEKGVEEALCHTHLQPVDRPEIDFGDMKFEKGKPVEFKVKFEVEPEIELKNYKGIPVAKLTTEVTDLEVDQVVDRLRDNSAIMEPLEGERPEKGYFAETWVSFTTQDDKEKVEVTGENATLEVGVDKVLPEIDKALHEMKTGEEREISLTFPEDYFDKKVAGRPAHFKIKLLDLKKKTLPELTDEFANTLKPGDTVLSLKTEVRKSIADSKVSENRNRHREEIVDYLVKNNAFAVPKAMIHRQAERIYKNMHEEYKRRGSELPKFNEAQEKSLLDSAERMVKGSLLLRAVAEKEGLQADVEKIDKQIASIAEGTQQTPEQVKKFLESRGILDQMRSEALTDQVFDFLLLHAQKDG